MPFSFRDTARDVVSLVEDRVGAVTDNSLVDAVSRALSGAFGRANPLLLDPGTGLLDRPAWDRLLLAEDERCRRHGNPASVVVVRLAGPDDASRAADSLRRTNRLHDLVARISDAELAVLATECPADEAGAVVERLREQLAGDGVAASIGVAGRHPGLELLAAFAEACAQAAEAAGA